MLGIPLPHQIYMARDDKGRFISDEEFLKRENSEVVDVPEQILEMNTETGEVIEVEETPLVSDEDKVEEARQAMVDCQGDRMFSDIGMNDEFWSLQDAYNKALADSIN